MKIESSKNVNTGNIQAGRNLAFGDNNTIVDGNGNTIINLQEAAQHKELQSQLELLNERFIKVQAKITQYPDDEDFKVDLLKISEEQNNVKDKIETLKREVLKLAEDFSKIPINTERLRLAKQHFEAGEFDKARAILDAEAMTTELNALKEEQERLKEKTLENQQQLEDKANEFLILARLTAIDFSLPDRFKKAKQYFEQSIHAIRNGDNLFEYANFLYNHNQFNEASALFEEVLKITKELAKNNSEDHLANLAATLNNLGNLHWEQHNYTAASDAYKEAFIISRELAQLNPESFLPHVATTLNNLGLLQEEQNDYTAASQALEEALKIRRELAQTNPGTFLTLVATTLNNLGSLHWKEHNNTVALQAYGEALEIYRKLAQTNPEAFQPDLALTAVNMSIFYLQSQPEKEKSLALAREAAQSALPYVEVSPTAKNYINKAQQVVNAWGVNAETFLQDVLNKIK